MVKRTICAFLWLLSAWTVGSILTTFAGAPSLLGPTLGILAGAIVWWDPAQWLWNRPVAASPALRRRLADLERTSAEAPGGETHQETGPAHG